MKRLKRKNLLPRLNKENIAVHYEPATLATVREGESDYGYCHTHGLEERFKHPEIVIRFFSASKAQQIVDEIVERFLSKGERLEEDVKYEGLLSVPVMFKWMEIGGRKCLEMLIPKEGNEKWIRPDDVVREVERLRGIDDLVQLRRRSVSTGIVLSHWGCSK